MAIADGDARRATRCSARPSAARERGAGVPSARARLRRRRALLAWRTCGAASRWRAARASATSSCTLSLDGRDTPPALGPGYLAEVEDCLPTRAWARIGSVVGRYCAMDRDKRWERVQLAYDLLVHGRASASAPSGSEAARGGAYDARRDRRVHRADAGRRAASAHRVRDGDVVLCFNFRPDRMRELTRAFYRRSRSPSSTAARSRRGRGFVDDDPVQKDFPLPVAFAPAARRATAAEVMAGARPQPAPRRRDREVPPRDVLLQRRRRAAPSPGETARAGALARATSPPTTSSRR